MHDGRNLFLPEEAFLGQEWEIDETLTLLNSMNLIDQDPGRRNPRRKPQRRLHAAGVRELRPVHRRGSEALDRSPFPDPRRTGEHRRDGILARRSRLVLPRLAMARGLRQCRLPVDHLLPPRRPDDEGPEGRARRAPRSQDLPRQRLAGGQLRGHPEHGPHPSSSEGSSWAGTSSTSPSPTPSTTRAPGRRAAIFRSSSSPESSAGRGRDRRSRQRQSRAVSNPGVPPRPSRGPYRSLESPPSAAASTGAAPTNEPPSRQGKRVGLSRLASTRARWSFR